MIEPKDDNYRLAQQHQRADRPAEAESAYRRVLATHPQHAGALHGLGTLAILADRAKLAEQLIRRAIAIRGEWPEACYHLGVALQEQENFDEAIPAYRRAISLNPALFDPHYNLAVCLQLTGQRDKAIAAYRSAISLRANDPFVLTNFAIALQADRQFDEAIAMLRQALSIKPDFADAHHQLGVALRNAALFEEAISPLTRAVTLKPKLHAAWILLASAYCETGQIEEAITAQRQAVALRPEDAESNFALGKLLLLRGDSAEGLQLLEWRWKRKTLPWPRRRFSQAMWDGSNLAGRTIYLHGEQTISDTIQFSRYISLVSHHGGNIVVECQPGLRRLLENSFEVRQWFSPGEPAPAFDVYCPLKSLPRLLGPLPMDRAYLQVPPESAEAWRYKAANETKLLKVGLVWAGSPAEIENSKRSMPLADLAPLGQVFGVRWFSLQKGFRASQARKSPAPFELADFTETLVDFADTAALVSQLDLVISIDSAVAHLAGALGKPVWALLPAVPHWRWGLQGHTTPWYPTMRLFRQHARGDWAGVVRQVAEALRQWTPMSRS